MNQVTKLRILSARWKDFIYSGHLVGTLDLDLTRLLGYGNQNLGYNILSLLEYIMHVLCIRH